MTSHRSGRFARFVGGKSWRTRASAGLMAMSLGAPLGCAPADEPLRRSGDGSEPAETASARMNPGGTGEQVAAKIDNATGGTVELSDGTKIEAPPGALPPGVDTITVTSSPEPAPADYAALSPVYVFEPEGTVFLRPLKVSIPFRAPAGKSTETLTVLWSRSRGDGFDMVPTTFEAVPGTTSDFIAIGAVTHFSKGMCGEKFAVDPRPTADPYADE